MTRTCRASSHLYYSLISLQLWNIDRDLQRFVREPRRFREQLGKCDGLISGSFALQFFEREYWEGSDLDIYVEEGKGGLGLGRYLVYVEGYDLVKKSFSLDYRLDTRSEVHYHPLCEKSILE